MRNNVDDKNNLDYDTFTVLYFIFDVSHYRDIIHQSSIQWHSLDIALELQWGLEDEVHHEQFNHSNIIFTSTLTIGNDMENGETQAPRRNAIGYMQSSDTLIIYK